MAGVLGCSEDGYGVGGLGVVLAGDDGDLLVDPEAPGGSDDQDHDEKPAEDETAGGGSSF